MSIELVRTTGFVKGLGTLQQRAYTLLTAALGERGYSGERQRLAITAWLRFAHRHPQFRSSLVNDDGQVAS